MPEYFINNAIELQIMSCSVAESNKHFRKSCAICANRNYGPCEDADGKTLCPIKAQHEDEVEFHVRMGEWF